MWIKCIIVYTFQGCHEMTQKEFKAWLKTNEAQEMVDILPSRGGKSQQKDLCPK